MPTDSAPSNAPAQWPGTWGITAHDVAVALGLPSPTPQQRAVIEAPPAPALVVAGAGSGKTETMAGRVVWLVANGHVRRDEVLGLTFTRKAAGELAERIGRRLARVDEYARRGLLPVVHDMVQRGELQGLAEADTAERIQRLDALAARYASDADAHAPGAEDVLMRPRVSTYNAFADGLVRENAARIGRDPEAALLSASASWLLARDLIVASDDPALAEGETSLSTLVEAVTGLAGDALDHRADLATVERFATETANALNDLTNRSLQTEGPVEQAHTAAMNLALVARLAREYDETKHAQSVLDFADQVSGALRVVESSPEIGVDLRAQFRVVLLDEYQDTSVLQTMLLGTLFVDTPVMAVGDPHQSIYGWRGASADNLAVFDQAFSRDVSAERYNLSISWRNDEAILASANALLAPATAAARIDVEPLRARPGAGTGRVHWVYPETIDAEADAVAQWFVQLRAEHAAKDDSSAHTGAILFRAKTHMPLFAEALERRGVPHRILGLGGLINTPEITEVVATLRVIDDPAQGSSLLRILAGPRFAVGVADLAALQGFARALAERDEALHPFDEDLRQRLRQSAGLDEQGSIIDALDVLRSLPEGYRMLDGFTALGVERLREAGDMFARLRRSVTQPIPDLLRHIETELRLDIELGANESRGAARTASTQLRAFGDAVRAFLDAAPRGTVGALLSWLARAEHIDELMPRPEPPEPGVVQLLTIHGSKGLEWDAAAVVRNVTGELPQSPRSRLGWLSTGQLPHRFRGDRAALPDVDLRAEHGTTRSDMAKRIKAYIDEMGDYLEAEERRLTYVAVTRARTDLMLSGSWWGGQTRSRAPGAYLKEVSEALGLGVDSLEGPESEENPYSAQGATMVWPPDALGSRRPATEAAAAAVQAEMRRDGDGSNGGPAPTEELRRLLLERDQRGRVTLDDAPVRVPASRFKDYVTDFDSTVRAITRPMPERPYRQTRLGTLFHSWVENRSGMTGRSDVLDVALWESDSDDPFTPGMQGEALTRADADELARLQSIFERSEWADLQPLSVEQEINFALRGADGPQIVICKLDAVYRRADRGDRIEIVDWKTGRPPRDEEEREERLLQLALYRLAYHRRFGVPINEIDVALFYVGDDLVVRGERVYSEEELVQRWNAARAAR